MAIVGRLALPSPLQLPIIVVSLVVGLVGVVFVFMLATKVYGIVLGVLLGILTIVPLLGLFILLIVTDKATKILRKNGHHVGLLGAKLSEFKT